MKKTVLFVFFMLSGVILGGFLADVTLGISWLKWLSVGKTVGISTAAPFLLDIGLLRLCFGFEFGLNIAQIITILLCFLLYRFFAKKLR